MYELKVEINRLGPKNFESDKVTVITKISKDECLSTAVNTIKAKILGEHAIAVKEEVVEVKVLKQKSTPPADIVGTKKEEEVVVAKKAKVVTKLKSTAYDRTLDTHKKLLSTFLDANSPGWKTKLAKAGEASTSLVGTPFLDGEGEMLQSFKDAFLAFLR
jgi:hypothetical protein